MAYIKNIIFDLGGVLLNIDYHKTFTAFRELGVQHFEEMFTQFHVNELFEKLETGKIGEDDFYETIKTHIPQTISNEKVANAWNAMILDFRTETLVVLKTLSANHDLYLLSNTNSIHLKYFRKIFTRDTGQPLLDSYFNKAWYSHLIGLRKPDRDIYEYVLGDAAINAAETLFIDDTIDNINAAMELGIQTLHLKSGKTIEDLGL